MFEGALYFHLEPILSRALFSPRQAADALITYGALVVKDSRVTEEDNEKFLDLLENYFALPIEELKKDERKEYGYQVGVTLENTEKPKCKSDDNCLRIIEKLAPSERPLDILGHGADPKCRFFWKLAEVPPYEIAFPSLNMPNVVPERFSDTWATTLDRWGQAMKNAVEGVAEMSSLGLGLENGTFKDSGRFGPHLLAPTASDLNKYGEKDTILAGFHSDLNFLTIHGRSRYPGLHIWARNTGQRIAVSIPPGRHLLVQAGKQLEHLTGGLIKAGLHEVVVNVRTVDVINKRRVELPERPLIRISSTFFWHLSSDVELQPIPELKERADTLRELNHEEVDEYPKMKVGEQVQNELRHIALMA